MNQFSAQCIGQGLTALEVGSEVNSERCHFDEELGSKLLPRCVNGQLRMVAKHEWSLR